MEKSRKRSIPKSLKKQVWDVNFGEVYSHKCSIVWCTTILTTFDFHVGHNIPESKGGTLDIQNLKPLCSSCNTSMGDRYTIDEWNKLSSRQKKYLWFWW